MVIPEAGNDVQWLKDNMAHFKEQGDEKDVAEFKALLDEIDTREDLKKLGLETNREKSEKEKKKDAEKKEGEKKDGEKKDGEKKEEEKKEEK